MSEVPLPPRPGGRGRREVLAGFRVYLTPGEVGTELPSPRAYTCYRGVPVACEARVVDADAERVQFKVSRYQANVLAETGFALIKSPLHGATFRAWTSAIDTAACLAAFDCFERHAPWAEHRTGVRVEPTAPIEAELRIGRQRWRGALLDVSVAAVALLVPDADPGVIGEGATVEIDAAVPETPEGDALRLRSAGTIVRVLAWAGDDPNDFRVVVRLEADDALRARVADYVAEQQSSILIGLGRARTDD